MILHAIVADAGAAAWAARNGASVVQLRLKDTPTARRVQVGRQAIAGVRDLAMIVIIVVTIVVYALLQRRASRWLR